MRVVVTGSSGFLGSRLVGPLAARGHDVVGIDRRRPGPGVSAPAGGLLLGELTDSRLTAELTALLGGADAVVHLAALPGVRNSARGPLPRMADRGDSRHGLAVGRPVVPEPDRDDGLGAARERDIVHSTERVLSLTPDSTALVVASSSAVYGGSHDELGDPRPSRESDPLRPRGGYARCKARAEAACESRAGRGPVTVVRPFTVVGEGQRPDMAVSLWLADALAGRPLRVLGSLDRTRDVTDVDLVAAGLVAAVERRPMGQGLDVVNLGAGRPRTLAEIVEAVDQAVAQELGPRRLEVVVAPAAAEEVTGTWACTRRAREVLGVDLTTDLLAVVTRQLRHGLHAGLLLDPRRTDAASAAASAATATDALAAISDTAAGGDTAGAKDTAAARDTAGDGPGGRVSRRRRSRSPAGHPSSRTEPPARPHRVASAVGGTAATTVTR